MPHLRPASKRPRRRSSALPTILVVAAALVVALMYASSASSSASADRQHAGLDGADGVVPDGTTSLDDVPAVTNLDPALLAALRRAAGDAAGDGITLGVNSGWRSAAYQDQLLREAVSEHGSADEAARWVATADTSPHVSGDAIDIGGTDAAAWLADHGATYGLCRIYRNEPWHFELRAQAVGGGCPAMYADAAHDPRMQD